MDTQEDTLQIFTDGETKKLTEWKNEPSVKDLKADFLEAKSIHDSQKSKISTWLDNLRVEGKAKVNPPKGKSRVVPKLIRKQAEWRYASLSEPFLSTEDIFNVRPVSWEDRKAAIQNQLVLSHQFNTQIDKVAFIDEYVRTGVDEGTIIVRVGWKFEEEEYQTEEPIVTFVVNPQMAQVHQEIAMLKQQSPSEYDTNIPDEMKQAHELTIQQGQPIEPIIEGYQEVTKVRTVQNRPTVEVCDYNNVLVDPTCNGKIEDASFVIYSFESSLSQLKKDGKYSNLEQINLGTESVLGDPDHESSDGSKNFNFSDNPRKKFVVYEYWGYWDIDGTGRVKPIVASWVGNTLIRMEENPYPDKKLPFIVVQFLPVRKNIYGEPDGVLLDDNQRIMGAVTRGMIDLLANSANGQTGIAKGVLDAVNRRKFENGQDYEYNPGTHPAEAIFMHQFPEIPQSASIMLQYQQQEAESLTGVKSYANGIASNSLGDVAAGIRGALDASSKRELGILRRLAKGVIEIGNKIISMNAEFLSEEEVVRISNEQFVTVRRDDLPGNFDLRLSISTAEEDNNKAQELAFMLQTMGNNMDPEMSKMILSDIARLRKMPDLAHKIEAYQPQPDPLLEKQKELEIQLLEAKIMNERAMAQERMANAQLDMAKIQTEQVKAGNLQSDTDLKNLDFVEQESGVKQARDMEKQGEQARAQAQMKVLDHSMKMQLEKEKSKAKK